MDRAITEQELIMRMDIAGYEQDGSGYDFISHKECKTIHFNSLKDLFYFACENRIV